MKGGGLPGSVFNPDLPYKICMQDTCNLRTKLYRLKPISQCICCLPNTAIEGSCNHSRRPAWVPVWARIDHSKLYSDKSGVYTDRAEEFFFRMRRAEIGHHHHIAGTYLIRYAQESAWREDHRRMANGM